MDVVRGREYSTLTVNGGGLDALEIGDADDVCDAEKLGTAVENDLPRMTPITDRMLSTGSSMDLPRTLAEVTLIGSVLLSALALERTR